MVAAGGRRFWPSIGIMFEADKIWENYIHPDDRELFKKDIELVFSGRKPFHDIEYRARLKDGTYVRCTCEGCVLKDGRKGNRICLPEA